MARIRTIKPDFWTDDKLTECSLSARLLFIGTWNFADDAGNLDRSPKQIKARVFPLDNIDCEPLLLELITQGLLTEYSVDGKKYLHVQGFAKHQVINRPSAPTCPAFDESPTTQPVLNDDSLSTHDGREGKGREGKNNSNADALLVGSKAADQGDDPKDEPNRLPNCPHQKIVDLYGEIIPEQPQPRSWDGQRADYLRARWRWVLTAKKRSGERYATTEDEGIEFFRRMFGYMRDSDFLMKQWTSWDLGWIVKAENFEKIIAGNYENKVTQ